MITQGQSYRVTFNLSTDLTTATIVQIGYTDPTRTTSYVTATIDNTVSGIVHYDVNSTLNAIAGNWYWWVKATFSDGNIYISEAKTVKVHTVGEPVR